MHLDDKFWTGREQKASFRHKAALSLIKEGFEPILDIGCGDGLFLNLLKKRGFKRIEGLDHSRVAIKKVKKKDIGAKLMSLNRKLLYKDNRFKTIVALDVLEHVQNIDELLSEIWRITSDYFIVACPNFSNYKQRFGVLLGKAPSLLEKKHGHIKFITYSNLKCKLECIGFKIEDEIVTGLFDFKIKTNWLVKLWPNLLSSAFCFKCKKVTK